MADPIIFTPGQTVAPPDWNALLLQHGNLKSTVPVPNTDPRVASMIAADPNLASTLYQHPIYRYYMEDGSYVEAYNLENGQDVQIVDYKPSPKFAQQQRAENPTGSQRPANATPRVEGTPTGQTDANGQPVFDNSKPIMVWRTPDNKQAGPAEPLTEGQRAQWEREKNQGAGVGSYTDQQVAENASKNRTTSEQGAVPGYPGWTQRTQKDASGELTLYYPPNSTTPQTSLPEKPEAPTKPTYQTIKGGDGQDYIRSITIGPDGKPVIQAYGPQGQPVASIPGEKETPKLTQTRGDDGQVYTTVTTIGADNKVTVQTVDQRGNPVEKIPTKAPARERVQDPDTKQYLEKGDDNIWRPIKIEGQEAGGNQGPSLPHVVLGQMKDGLTTFREDLTHQVAAGTLTPAVAERRWKEATDIAEFGIREASLVQQDEQSRRSADVTLRTNAMSNGSSVFNNALDFVLKINPTLKIGSTAGARAFTEILGMHQQQMTNLGAYRNEFSGPNAPRGAAAASSVPGVSSPDRRPPTEVGQPGDPTLGESLAAPVAAQQQQAANPPTFTDPQTGQFGIPGSFSAGPAAAPSLIAGPGGAPSVDTGNVGISPDGSAAVAPDGSTAPVDVNRPLPTMDPNAAPPVGMGASEPDIGVLSAYQPMQAPIASPVAPVQDSAPLPGVLRAQQIASTPPWRLSDDDLQWAQQNGLLDHAMAVPGVGA